MDEKKLKYGGVEPFCNYCKTRNTDLLICGRCQSISYCGMKCQRDDWKKHRCVCICIDENTVKPRGRVDENGGEEEGNLPVRVIIPRGTREKCEYLDERDKEMDQGKEIFGQEIEPDELGWEDRSSDLRLNKLCEHIGLQGYSSFDFYCALWRVIDERVASNKIMDKGMTMEEKCRAHMNKELLLVCGYVGLSTEEGARAVEVIQHWRRVPCGYKWK